MRLFSYVGGIWTMVGTYLSGMEIEMPVNGRLLALCFWGISAEIKAAELPWKALCLEKWGS